MNEPRFIREELERCIQQNEDLRNMLAEKQPANWPCLCCGFGHSAAIDVGYEKELKDKVAAENKRVHRLLAALNRALQLLETPEKDFGEAEVAAMDELIGVLIDEAAKEGVDINTDDIPEDWATL